jgi:hypothetical protein
MAQVQLTQKGTLDRLSSISNETSVPLYGRRFGIAFKNIKLNVRFK